MRTDDRRAPPRRWITGTLVALLVTAAAFGVMVKIGTGTLLRPPAAPLASITFERVVLRPGTIEVHIRNGGRDPVSVAQVMIDDAYWNFTSEPRGPLGRLKTATLRLDYPWIAGEPVTIRLLDSIGTTFTHAIPVASVTPSPSGRTVLGYVVLGTYAGVVPVLLGLLFLPALQRLGPRGMRFVLGVTAGMLVFLAVDALAESLELSGRLAAPFQGSALIFGGAAASLLALVAVGRRLRSTAGDDGSPPPLALAFLIAVGIGLHNFGEGLAIGSAQALGEVALGTFLVVGFAVHNLTEGIGIVAPTVLKPPRPRELIALGAIAGLPTVAGTLIGGFAYSRVLAIGFLSLGVGAILQVVYELARLVRREASMSGGAWLLGIVAGFALMYLTGMMIR